MRQGTIHFHVAAAGVAFSVTAWRRKIAVDQWARHPIRNASKGAANVSPLLFLLEEEKASVIDDGFALLVEHEAIAALDGSLRKGLGLPPHPAAGLQLSSRGTVEDPAFELHAQFQMASGLPIRSYQRTGAFLKLGRREYTLDGDTYRILVALEEFQKNPGTTMEERLVSFGRLKRALPESARLGSGYLDELRIEFAPAFKLQVFRNAKGEADFNLEPCRWVRDDRGSGGLEEGEQIPASFLAPEALDSFSGYLRKRSRLLPAHPLPDGTILVLGEEARRAMEVAHRIQKEPPEVREAFLREPQRYLREAFGDDFDEERLESIFWEDDLSDRIRAIGLWQPPVLPWLTPAPTEWLPPQAGGLKIGDDTFEVHPEELPAMADLLARAIERGERSIAWDGREVPATPEALEAVERLIDAHGPKYRSPDADEPTAEAERPPPRILLTHMNHTDVQYKAALRRKLDADARVPQLLQTDPLPHQRDAIQWLQEHFLVGNPGAILADDMGLGKTLTALAFLSWLRGLETRELVVRRPTLLIAPTGLLSNWMEEHDKHLLTPGLGKRLLATGKGLAELRIGEGPDDPDAPVLDTKRLEASDWVLTTYETLRDYQPSFVRVKWGAVVLDEAQKVKNPAARVTNAINSVDASFRLVMTGTPVENRLADLWSIADVAWPGRLGDLRAFAQRYDEAPPEELLSLSQELMVESPPPLMKRRMKIDHLSGLPQKASLPWREFMPPVQADRYADAVRQARASDERGKMLGALHDFRRISLAPLSWLDAGADDEAWSRSSARLISLFRILDEAHAAGEKVLVFLEEKSVQADLRNVLQRRYDLAGLPMVINGDVTGPSRQRQVGVFQEEDGFDVMLLSPKAGGVGLTLTAANHVVHLSRWWNPAVEDQCSDRVYRIGQRRDVTIHHPLAIHPTFQDQSFDLLLDALLERKRSLSRHVLSPAAILQEQDGEDLFRRATQQTV